MRQNEAVKPFEFLFKINDNIICQRYFNIKNYNPKCRESLEMKDMIDEVMGMDNPLNLGILPEFFKKKCVESTWESYNPHQYQSRTKINSKNIYDKEDIFKFEVLERKEVVASGMFNGSPFQSGVRFNIRINEHINEIINVITFYMSLDKYQDKYADIKLERYNKYPSIID